MDRAVRRKRYVITVLTLSRVTQTLYPDVLLICPATHRSSIYHHIHSDVSSSSLRIDLQTCDESPESNIGTCALLRQFSSRISEDFVIVPCDFIPPQSLPLTLLLNKFRVDTLSEGSIATTCWYAPHDFEKAAFLEEWGPVPSSNPIIWDSSTGTLLHIDTMDDLDRNAEGIELKMSLLSRYVTLYLLMISLSLFSPDIRGPSYLLCFTIHMCISVADMFSTCYMKSNNLPHYERSFYHGFALFSTGESKKLDTDKVCSLSITSPFD